MTHLEGVPSRYRWRPSTLPMTSYHPKSAMIQSHIEYRQTDLTQARHREEHPYPLPTGIIPLLAVPDIHPSYKVVLKYGLSLPTWAPSTVVSTAIKVQGGTEWWPYSLPCWLGLLTQLVAFSPLCLQALVIEYCGGFDVKNGPGGGRKTPESDQTGRQGMHAWVLFTIVIGERFGRPTKTSTSTHLKRILFPFQTFYGFRPIWRMNIEISC